VSRHQPVAEAERAADEARARLIATAQELQERLSPKVLAHDAWEAAKAKGADLAEDAVDAVKARPWAATGVAAAIAAFLAREPLIEMAGQMFDGMGEKRAARKNRKAAAKKAAPVKAVAKKPPAKTAKKVETKQ